MNATIEIACIIFHKIETPIYVVNMRRDVSRNMKYEEDDEVNVPANVWASIFSYPRDPMYPPQVVLLTAVYIPSI
jgi:hypothetical protein